MSTKRFPVDIASLKINADRLNASIHSTASFGAALRYGDGPTETGMARLSLDDDDKLVRKWFSDEMESLGLSVKVDQLGNMFATRPGKKEGAPTAMASHLDTQPTGGRYDGILGVLSAVEAMRTIVENGLVTEYPMAVINWTNEEGARFPKSLQGSATYTGALSLESSWALADVKDPSATVKSELERIGYLGDEPCSFKANPIAAHFELHIEQGPILEKEGKKVGVVMGGQCYRWFTVDVHGRDCHTGSTPFSARSDAMLCAAQCIVASNRIAKKMGGLASTGILTLAPGSVNVCPSHVRFSLDIRHPITSKVDDISAAVKAEMERIAAEECEKGCTVDFTLDTDSPAVKFHPDAIAAVRQSAIAAVGEGDIQEIYSGAGHDSCALSHKVPTAMIFVPSKDGISHNPVEYTSPEECAIGAQVLMHAALNYDKFRTS